MLNKSRRAEPTIGIYRRIHTKNLLVCLMLSISCSWADTNLVRQMLQSVLSEPSDARHLGSQAFTLDLDDATRDLTDAEIESLLPLGMQCIRSHRPEARDAGISLIMTISVRRDGPRLMDRYIDELGAFLNEPQSLFRRTVLVMLTTRTEVSRKWISTVAAHLEDKSNSQEDTEAIVFSLLAASSSDPAMLHKVLMFVTKRSEGTVTISALRGLNLENRLTAEALDFIDISLNSTDHWIRQTAVDVIRMFPKDVRTKFAAQLGRIARDSKETELTRSLAAEALGK